MASPAIVSFSAPQTHFLSSHTILKKNLFEDESMGMFAIIAIQMNEKYDHIHSLWIFVRSDSLEYSFSLIMG